MAVPPSLIKSAYPLPAYNYRVSIGGIDLAFSEVSGLSLQYEPITYRHGLSWKEGAEYMPGMKQPVRVTLRRGIVQGRGDLLDWINTVQQNKVEKRDLVIHLCDESGNPLVSWLLRHGFPLKLDAPGFNANSNEAAIESMELMGGELLITFHHSTA
jgi:phage tail-like protein